MDSVLWHIAMLVVGAVQCIKSGHSICQFTASADSLQMPSGALFKDVLVALDSPAIGSENVGI
jgi:hypothetical protein